MQGLVVADAPATEGVPTVVVATTAPVGLQDDVHPAGRGREGQLDLADLPGVVGRRIELDLLVERQVLIDPAEVAHLQVGALEVEPELGEGPQHGLLRGQRRDLEGVQVALVDGLGDGQLGAHAHHHAVQRPAHHLGDRALPRDGELEGDGAMLAGAQRERPGDLGAEELDETGLLVLAVLGLDPGDQTEGDVLDVGVEVAARQADLAAQRVARPYPRGGQNGVHRGGADAEGSQHPFEDHGFLSPVRPM